MELSISIYYEDTSEIKAEECLKVLHNISLSINVLLGVNKTWYEKGYSRKEALKHIVMDSSHIQHVAIKRWEKRCKKSHPLLVEGIWDGGSDKDACDISYMKNNFLNMGRVNIEINISDEVGTVDIVKMINFMDELVKEKKDAYSFVHNNGYWFNDRNVFPDRIPCGWMLYVPHVVLTELIPEAAKIAPVMDEEGKQTGAIIISTESVFDGSKKEHIEKSNNIEIRLLDLGLLPLMTEL